MIGARPNTAFGSIAIQVVHRLLAQDQQDDAARRDTDITIASVGPVYLPYDETTSTETTALISGCSRTRTWWDPTVLIGSTISTRRRSS